MVIDTCAVEKPLIVLVHKSLRLGWVEIMETVLIVCFLGMVLAKGAGCQNTMRTPIPSKHIQVIDGCVGKWRRRRTTRWKSV